MTAPAVFAMEFFVPGKPAPQGSMKAVISRSTGRPMVKKDNESTQVNWRSLVAWAASQAYDGSLLGEAVAIELDFVMPRVTGLPKRKPTPAHTKKPDIDKLSRNVLDALTSVIYRDDSQVVDLHPTKRYAEIDETPGVHIRVRPARPKRIHDQLPPIECPTCDYPRGEPEPVRCPDCGH